MGRATGRTGATIAALTLAATLGCGGADSRSSYHDGLTSWLCGGSIVGVPLPLAGEVTTFAGVAGAYASVDGTGDEARFREPYGIACDGDSLYVTDKDGDEVRRIDALTGVVTTLVPPTEGLREPVGITTDGAFAYVCDSENDAIRKVDLTDGTMTLLAGGTSGALDGVGPAAQFGEPYGVTVVEDYLYVSDRRNHAIRRVHKVTGEVVTVAGALGEPGAVDGSAFVARFNEPRGITSDCESLYVGDWNNFTIRRVSLATGAVTTLAGTVGVPGADDGVGTAATFYGPRGLGCDGTYVYVGDYYLRHGGQPVPPVEPPEESSLVRRVHIASRVVTTLADAPGTSGSADDPVGALARFLQPSGLATDGTTLFVTDRKNCTVRAIR